MNEKILIIGGCGYIGAKLFLFLKNKNSIIETVDLEWWGNFTNKENKKKDYNKLTEKYLNKFSTIIFLAGHSNPLVSMDYPLSAIKNNTFNFISLYNKISKNTKFIYASTIGVYGITEEEADENFCKFNPLNIYDLSKITSDLYIKIHNNQNYFGLRFGVVNGASSNFRKDTMLNSMAFNAINSKALIINNKNITRAVLGLNDLCEAIFMIINSNNDKYGIYNLCSFNSTVLEMAEKTANYFNADITYQPDKKNIYSSKVCSDKFIKNFNFEFKDTILSIVKDIDLNYDKLNITERFSKNHENK